jgi:hypothetical protein
LLPALFLGFVRHAAAQPSPISSYETLANALGGGYTHITNFSTNNSLTAPLKITWPAAGGGMFQVGSNYLGINVTIDAGTNTVVFKGNGLARFFYVHSTGVLTLNNLALTNGASTNGGAIYNMGTLILSNCVLAGNSATNINGITGSNGPTYGGSGTNGTSGGPAYGGAIYSTGALYISYSLFTSNFALAGSGGNGGSGTYSAGSPGYGGNAGYGTNAYGGAIYSTGLTNVFYMTEFVQNVCEAGNGGTGGVSTTNQITQYGGEAGLGGDSEGGAVYVSGGLDVTNCIFVSNYAVGGNTGWAEVDSDGGGEDGSPGGSAFGGAMFLTGKSVSAIIQNSIFIDNVCDGGDGGGTVLTNADGGAGGDAFGGAIWSQNTVTLMSFCTLATNTVIAGPGGTNIGNVSYSGTNGIANGLSIYKYSGSFDLADSILSYGATGTLPNAFGVTDGGYNVCSDHSLVKSTIVPTTMLGTNCHLGLLQAALNAPIVGGNNGVPIATLPLLTNSPAAAFVPGIPGLTFPLNDEILNYRSTPTCAGASESAPILSLVPYPDALLPDITSTLPGTNFTDTGYTASFTATVNSNTYYNLLPFGYQWQFNGSNIYDGNNFSGTASNVLVVNHVNITNQGIYTVLASPTLFEGATTSAVVQLVLTNPPVINEQPVSQTRPAGSIVVLAVGVVSPLNYGYYWSLNGSNLPAGPEYSGVNSNVLTINPATAVDAGTYAVLVSNNFGFSNSFKESAKVRLTIVPDRTKPSVLITSPTNHVRTNTFAFYGTATDNAQVVGVTYWLTNINAGFGSKGVTVVSNSAILTTNGSTNFSGSNTKNWSITNQPLPGTNILAVQSIDYSGNISPVVTRSFFYQVPSTLSLTAVSNGGTGYLTGHAFLHGDTIPANGASLNIGERYSIVATPGASSLLGAWTNSSGSYASVTNGTTLYFIMESNTAIQASFVSNMFLGIHGTYNGLFYDTNEIIANNATNPAIDFQTAGMIHNLALGQKGTFSGQLLLAGGTYSLSGALDAYGQSTNTIVRSEKLGGNLIVTLAAPTNDSGIMTGTVSNASWTNSSTLTANVNGNTGAGNYTMLLFPPNASATNTTSPTGNGYASITDKNGSVTLAGALADGTAFTQNVPASQNSDVPVCVNLYNKTGFLFGWLNLTNFYGTNLVNLVWTKPAQKNTNTLFFAGFTNVLETQGSVWVEPVGLNIAVTNSLHIFNGGLADALDYTNLGVKSGVNLTNAAGSTPTNSLAGSVTLKNGLVKITFGTGNGRATDTAYGAILQNTYAGAGYFVTKTNAGSFILTGLGSLLPAGDNMGDGSITITAISSVPSLPPNILPLLSQTQPAGETNAPPAPPQ